MRMPYPTMEEVNAASRYQLGVWYRFLESPGMAAVGTERFQAEMEREAKIQERILERFQQLGGWYAGLSKEVGWDRP